MPDSQRVSQIYNLGLISMTRLINNIRNEKKGQHQDEFCYTCYNCHEFLIDSDANIWDVNQNNVSHPLEHNKLSFTSNGNEY